VKPIGPKIAEGRDSEIFEHGPGTVLRVPFDGRSLEAEARVMAHVHELGYPVPRVHDAGEGFLVMDRVDGRTMMDDAASHPWRLRSHGRTLARLHRDLHTIDGPDWLPMELRAPGDRLLHRDLHPLNILMSADGPVVIDWANAARGDPAYDVADVWVLLATAEAPASRLERPLIAIGRRILLRSFLGGVDRAAARAAIGAVVEHRANHRNHGETERAAMRKLAEWASNV
jgi:aminoglycoside phosphotransferase (APT) family kinase protein